MILYVIIIVQIHKLFFHNSSVLWRIFSRKRFNRGIYYSLYKYFQKKNRHLYFQALLYFFRLMFFSIPMNNDLFVSQPHRHMSHRQFWCAQNIQRNFFTVLWRKIQFFRIRYADDMSTRFLMSSRTRYVFINFFTVLKRLAVSFIDLYYP